MFKPFYIYCLMCEPLDFKIMNGQQWEDPKTSMEGPGTEGFEKVGRRGGTGARQKDSGSAFWQGYMSIFDL